MIAFTVIGVLVAGMFALGALAALVMAVFNQHSHSNMYGADTSHYHNPVLQEHNHGEYAPYHVEGEVEAISQDVDQLMDELSALAARIVALEKGKK